MQVPDPTEVKRPPPCHRSGSEILPPAVRQSPWSPKQRIGASDVKDEITEPHPQERADLMAEKADTEQRSQVAGAKNPRYEPARQRYAAKPRQSLQPVRWTPTK